jgi:predicted DNA binding protein
MPIHEIVFRVRRDSEYLRILERNPAVRGYTSCNRVRDIVEVVSDDREQLENVLNEVSPESEIVDISSDYTRIYLVVSNCSCTPENSVPFNMEDLELIHMSPSFTSAGWEQFWVLAFKHEAMTTLIDRLERRGFQVDIRRKILFQGDVGDSMLTVESLFSELTGRQADAMITAFNHGYYRTPRGAT